MSILEKQMMLGESLSVGKVSAWETAVWTDDICKKCGKKTVFMCENEAHICICCGFSPELGIEVDTYWN